MNRNTVKRGATNEPRPGQRPVPQYRGWEREEEGRDRRHAVTLLYCMCTPVINTVWMRGPDSMVDIKLPARSSDETC